ncbi:BF3164 family lipoprotein [Parabacteroides bouchesdurhonensis]|uniref:BF3164 family lipoprotein n=1 Tax=Parabacteroides bouchesdurhonensis TaxID=1936995 RepID=UPI000E526397|nr:BF3164 family lipoprotein [Parabacteroides bouchesdurhonensis]RHJ93004.1 hypothetical protein DW095_06515 [Bacteroides sp. AM07-16]
MKTIHFLILFSFLLGSVSCNSKLSYENSSLLQWDDFSHFSELQSKNLKFREPLLRPTRVYCINNTLIFKDDSEDNILHQYDSKTLQKKGSFFTFGSGPDEFLWIHHCQPLDTNIWISDLQKRSINQYDIKMINKMDSNNIKAIKRIQFEDHFSSITVLPNGHFMATINNPKHKRITLFDENGNFIKTAGEFPPFQKELTPFESIEGFYCSIVLSPYKNFIYLFYKQTDLIEQYDLEGNLIKRIHGPEHFFPEVKEASKNDMTHVSSIPEKSKDAYFCPVVTNDKMYVLYSGAYFDPKQPTYLMKHLFVFNNDGTPIQRYLLDQSIFCFAVNEETNKLYGISNDPEFHIVEYSLKF